jgi:prepilin-type N-terminal cleavage/methylation domain-containing protein
MEQDLSKRGYSLVELVIVILAIAVLAVIVIARWPDKSNELNGQSKQLASDLRYVQQLSMARNKPYRIQLNLVTGYRFFDDQGNSVPHPAANPGSTMINLGGGITLSGGGVVYLVFDGKGVPYLSSVINQKGTKAVADLTLTLTPQVGTLSRNIIVQANTGYVSVQ